MAYDVYIVRTENWLDAATAPITKQDVDALIAGDSELVWSTTDYVDMSDDAGAVTRYWMIRWRDQPCFWWYRDQIQCSGPDEAQISKLVQMSRVLGARVIGDDGEEYPLEQQPGPPAYRFACNTIADALATLEAVARRFRAGLRSPWSEAFDLWRVS